MESREIAGYKLPATERMKEVANEYGCSVTKMEKQMTMGKYSPIQKVRIATGLFGKYCMSTIIPQMLSKINTPIKQNIKDANMVATWLGNDPKKYAQYVQLNCDNKLPSLSVPSLIIAKPLLKLPMPCR